MSKKNILVMAYALSPTRGSEYSVAWNYVCNMSKHHNLTVLYGASGDHMGDCSEMEVYAREHKMDNVTFVPIHPDRITNMLNWPNRHGVLVYTFYYAYQRWQWQAYMKAKELMQTTRFDLVHFVGMIGYREPGYLWRLGLPYVWGPISGANNSPPSLMGRMSLGDRLKHRFRSVANSWQLRHSMRLRQALAHTDILLTASSENQKAFAEVHKMESICMPENVIRGEVSLCTDKFMKDGAINIIVVGCIDARKAVTTFLQALTLVKHKERMHVDIVGDGPLRPSLQRYAAEHELEPLITWHGQLPRAATVEMFRSAHLHVITSISEGNPTTVWEAMSHGVPTLSFDHCGMHDTLAGGAGILVPIADDYAENVRRVAHELDRLLAEPQERRRLAEATLQRAEQYTWQERRQFWNELYDRLCTRNT